MKKLLIPIDGSEHAQRAMERGKELAEKFGWDIVLLSVEVLPIPYVDQVITLNAINQTNEDLKILLDEAKKNFVHFSNEVQVVSLRGDVASTIIKYIEDNDIEMVVMGSVGLNAGVISGLLLGSVTNKVLHKSCVPVLVVK
ncbi:hypothetical protein GC105_00500 [Alkalibaculum sp. M08DMB]|uniref:UspA domain-containing protein n=1 Tax=Alkalibaculum sporogenes TaxID=2655001 RepID=A0A6A7K4N9_9FIRM|nr:universal stress protein [Alkalibaculum sporogenes]MPW24274.1 hypothetical protein [Alkalibaculum sporogenes]